jgi:hypothetical protein
MRIPASLASLPKLPLFGAILACSILASTSAEAGRGISIDVNTVEIWSDAEDAQVVPLPFPVNYGVGLQPSVVVQLPDGFNTDISGLNFAVVGLTFTNSPSDSLFATVNGSGTGSDIPGLRMSTPTEQSTPANPVDEASIFTFGNVVQAVMPPPSDTSGCDLSGGVTYCYGPMADSATFTFIDRSSDGSAGDFELILQCGELCGNIGFNLGGLSFSADDFDPNAPLPPQLVSFSLGDQNDFFHPGTWDFLFRNSSSVPEPGTWAMMLLGFGAIGVAIRRQDRRKLRLS